MLGLTFDKIMLLAVVAAVLLGPRRLPAAASSLARLVRTLRSYATDAQERVRKEVGPEFDEFDWRQLDPRQYDPRRIIRDALVEPMRAPEKASTQDRGTHEDDPASESRRAPSSDSASG